VINFYSKYLFHVFCVVISCEQVSIPSISNDQHLVVCLVVVPARLWHQTTPAAKKSEINDEETDLITIDRKICHLRLHNLVFTSITRHVLLRFRRYPSCTEKTVFVPDVLFRHVFSTLFQHLPDILHFHIRFLHLCRRSCIRFTRMQRPFALPAQQISSC
jgi:hypothetical protein